MPASGLVVGRRNKFSALAHWPAHRRPIASGFCMGTNPAICVTGFYQSEDTDHLGPKLAERSAGRGNLRGPSFTESLAKFRDVRRRHHLGRGISKNT